MSQELADMVTRAVCAQVVILTADGDDGLLGWFVKVVRRRLSARPSHRVQLLSLGANPVVPDFLADFLEPHATTRGGTQRW